MRALGIRIRFQIMQQPQEPSCDGTLATRQTEQPTLQPAASARPSEAEEMLAKVLEDDESPVAEPPKVIAMDHLITAHIFRERDGDGSIAKSADHSLSATGKNPMAALANLLKLQGDV